MCIVIITSIIRIYSEFIFVLFTEFFIKHNVTNWIYFEAIKVCIMKLIIQYLYFNMILFCCYFKDNYLVDLELFFPMMLIEY